jgi:exopolysaccharide production protein ExoQ
MDPSTVRRGPSAPRPRPHPPISRAATPGIAGSRQYSLILGLMVWVLIALVIPKNILETQDVALDFTAPNPLVRIVKLSLLAICSVIVFRRWKSATLLLKNLNPFFIGFLVLAPLSAIWSISPADTIARCITVFTIMFVSFAFALSSWSNSRFQNVLRPGLTLFLFASLIFCLAYPELGIERSSNFELKGAWHGLAPQKNGLGQIAGFGTILWTHAYLTKQVRLWRAIVGGAISVTCLFASRSSTSILSSGLACFFIVLVTRSTSLRRYLPYITGVFASVTLAYALAVLGVIPGLSLLLAPVMSLTGKDATFSGRSQIWEIVREHIRLSPWVGSGYGAYWVGNVSWSPSSVFMGRLYFYPTESHNGYLEVINDLGYVGLACLFGYLFVYVRNSIRLLKIDRNQAALLLAIFFQQVIINLSESCWFSYTSFSFDVMALATVALSRSLLEQRLPEHGLRGTQGIGNRV